MEPRITHLRPKLSVQRETPGAVLKYGEDVPELISRFWAKSTLQGPALPELEVCGA